MIQSTKNAIKSEMNNEEYINYIQSIANQYNLDMERSNMIILVKNRIDKEMYKKLDTYKKEYKLRNMKQKLESLK